VVEEAGPEKNLFGRNGAGGFKGKWENETGTWRGKISLETAQQEKETDRQAIFAKGVLRRPGKKVVLHGGGGKRREGPPNSLEEVLRGEKKGGAADYEATPKSGLGEGRGAIMPPRRVTQD